MRNSPHGLRGEPASSRSSAHESPIIYYNVDSVAVRITQRPASNAVRYLPRIAGVLAVEAVAGLMD